MMEFRIADTFVDSLAKLTGDEQKAVKTTAFDLQMNPASPGMQFHRVDRSRDRNFWSVRVSRDLRVIVHKTDSSLMLCYVDHHDDAYAWAERRKIERHPKTGAAQLVVVRETVKDILVPRYVDAVAERPKALPPLFTHVPADDLLNYGVPVEWLEDVRGATEDSLFDLADHLPQEASEALLELATGGKPALVAAHADEVIDAAYETREPGVGKQMEELEGAFSHPDAQRRFRTVDSADTLRQALDYPWEKWTVFLHPEQRAVVERRFGGPARVSGSAGTGKTIVALHRAVHLARAHPDSRVLLATFSVALANSLRQKLDRLVGHEPDVGKRITVSTVDDVGLQLHEDAIGAPSIASDTTVRELLVAASEDAPEHRFSDTFLWTEWTDVVDAWQIDDWPRYRDVARLGRRTRLGERQREHLWGIFGAVRASLADQGLVTMPQVFARVAAWLQGEGAAPFDFAVIDEAQDIGVAQLSFLAAFRGSRGDSLFFAGDLGQRIFRTPFSWKSLGVDVRGRSSVLRVNYRTSHQIRRQADRLLPSEISDVDGNTELRRGTVSAFSGPEPLVSVARSMKEERDTAARWLGARLGEGLVPEEIAVVVRSESELGRAKAAVEAAGAQPVVLDVDVETAPGCLAVCTMHLAKGLEFRAVAVMACDDEVIPSQERIESVSDASDLEDVYNTERHLLYVACTRARDHLLVIGVEPETEFLEDLRWSRYVGAGGVPSPGPQTSLCETD